MGVSASTRAHPSFPFSGTLAVILAGDLAVGGTFCKWENAPPHPYAGGETTLCLMNGRPTKGYILITTRGQ